MVALLCRKFTSHLPLFLPIQFNHDERPYLSI